MDLSTIKEYLIHDIIQGWELAEEDSVVSSKNPERRCLQKLSRQELYFLASTALYTLISNTCVILNEYMQDDDYEKQHSH